MTSEEILQFWPDLVYDSSNSATSPSSLDPPCLWLLIQLQDEGKEEKRRKLNQKQGHLKPGQDRCVTDVWDKGKNIKLCWCDSN